MAHPRTFGLRDLLRKYYVHNVIFEHSVSWACYLTLNIDGITEMQEEIHDTMYKSDTINPVLIDKSTQTQSEILKKGSKLLSDNNGQTENLIIKEEPFGCHDNEAVLLQPDSPETPAGGAGNTASESEISCPLCSQHFYEQHAIEQHLKTDHDIGNVYICTICREVCMSNSALIDHVTAHHSSTERKHTRGRKGNSRKNEPKKVLVSRIKIQKNVSKSSRSKVKISKNRVSLKENAGEVNKGKQLKQTQKGELKVKNRSRKVKVNNKNVVTGKNEIEQLAIISNESSMSENDITGNISVSDMSNMLDKSFIPEAGKSQVKCSKCGKIYSSKRGLRRHFTIQHDQHEYPCEHCGKKLTGKESLYHHIRGIHMKIKPYKCQEPGCDAAFNFSHSLRLHVLKHTGSRPHMCTTCGKTYLTSYHLKVHIQATHSDNKNFACSTCDKTFSYSTSLKIHEATHKQTQRVSCNQCDKTFVNGQALKFHIMTKHADKGQQAKCTHCDKVYSSELALRTHMRKHTPAGNRFMCDVCGARFMFRSALEMHKAIHRDEKAFTCKICNKSFKTYPTLYSHQSVHKKDSPYQCGQCGKAFKTKERCKAHEKRHTGDKPFQCHICQHSFPDKGGWSKHMRTVHCSVKKFVCFICGKATSRADNLRVHMKVHDKPEAKNQNIDLSSRKVTSQKALNQQNILPTVVPKTFNAVFEQTANEKLPRNKRPRHALINPEGDANMTVEKEQKINPSDTDTFVSNLPHFSSLDHALSTDYQSIPLNLHNTSTTSSSSSSNINISNVSVPSIVHLQQLGHQQYNNLSLPLLPEMSQTTTTMVANNLHSLQPATFVAWQYMQGIESNHSN